MQYRINAAHDMAFQFITQTAPSMGVYKLYQLNLNPSIKNNWTREPLFINTWSSHESLILIHYRSWVVSPNMWDKAPLWVIEYDRILPGEVSVWISSSRKCWLYLPGQCQVMLHHHYKIDKRSAGGKQQMMEKGRENQQPARHEEKKDRILMESPFYAKPL